jgi:hypothetical protein
MASIAMALSSLSVVCSSLLLKWWVEFQCDAVIPCMQLYVNCSIKVCNPVYDSNDIITLSWILAEAFIPTLIIINGIIFSLIIVTAPAPNQPVKKYKTSLSQWIMAHLIHSHSFFQCQWYINECDSFYLCDS